jgi:phytoene synthase
LTAAFHLPLPAPALPDDRLKDRDCMGFVDAFEPGERALWLDWARALRVADRLAESDSGGFGHFRASWGVVQSLGLSRDTPRARAWSAYLDALATYGADYVVRTLAEHDEMLLRLSGPLLQLAPHMPEELWESAAAFGALDQFYNNLRDMQEDAERGLCWLPEDVLREHGLTREDVISGRAPDRAGWQALMSRWLVVDRTRLFANSVGFVWTQDMHQSIAAMCAWTKRRYRRIADALDAVDYDYRRFPSRYWAEVRRELAGREAPCSDGAPR